METLLVISPPAAPPAPQHARAPEPLPLQWQLALEQARQEPGRERLAVQLLELVSWPNLTELPPQLNRRLVPVCALLWRKRTAGLLVARVLDLPDDETLTLLAALRRLGHVRPLEQGAALPEDVPLAAGESPPPQRRCSDTLAGRLWRHLTACC
ncbi:hypothetical protein [Caldimonas tepidiphila]|uniref:hypothetical protein n=1 Tax=Caldimonas tepidiphila TaxID=2315841 RepID=UPI0013007F2E|nr:hypothetical protein [Caldimonas tepidiphila]